jgi:rhamnosyl/mannosyltransferase
MKPVVLHVGKGYWPTLGGMETITRQLAEEAVSKGYEVKILAFGGAFSRERLNGVEVIKVPTLFTFGRAPVSHLFRRTFLGLVRAANIVHFHYPNPLAELSWLTVPKNERKKKLSICTYQSDPLKPELLLPLYLGLTKRFLKNCSHIVASSEQYRVSSPVLSQFGDRVRIIPLGVETDWGSNITESSREAAGNLLSGLPSPRVLFSGRFVYYKGLEYLLRALERVKGVSCVLVGDGPRRKALEKIARDLGLTERVLFTGHLDDGLYSAVYEKADIFVLPSVFRTEAFGLVALEAMNAGMPVITTELGTATSVYNLNGKTGYVIKPFDVKELADRISVLAFDSDLRNKMGTAARNHVRDNYSAKKMSKQYLDLYEDGLRNVFLQGREVVL